MTSTQFVETSINVKINCPSQDYTHLGDHTSLTCDKFPEFKHISNKEKVKNNIAVKYLKENKGITKQISTCISILG